MWVKSAPARKSIMGRGFKRYNYDLANVNISPDTRQCRGLFFFVRYRMSIRRNASAGDYRDFGLGIMLFLCINAGINVTILRTGPSNFRTVYPRAIGRLIFPDITSLNCKSIFKIGRGNLSAN